MFITLTNAVPDHRGNPVAIRSDLIVTVHTSTVVREDDVVETVTYVYVPPHGTWEVTESMEEVLALMGGASTDTVKVTSSKKPKASTPK